jgi:hypothetical protein
MLMAKKLCCCTMILYKNGLELVKKVIHTIITPIGYGSSLRKVFVVDDQLMGLKPHDRHIFSKVHITSVVMI